MDMARGGGGGWQKERGGGEGQGGGGDMGGGAGGGAGGGGHPPPYATKLPNLPAPISATYVRACYSPLVYNANTCFCMYTCTFTVYVLSTHKVLCCFMHCPLNLSF